MKLAQQAPRSITPSLHYSISHGVKTHLALLQNATAHVLANSAIGSLCTHRAVRPAVTGRWQDTVSHYTARTVARRQV
jgi:hypothetical protein